MSSYSVVTYLVFLFSVILLSVNLFSIKLFSAILFNVNLSVSFYTVPTYPLPPYLVLTSHFITYASVADILTVLKCFLHHSIVLLSTTTSSNYNTDIDWLQYHSKYMAPNSLPADVITILTFNVMK